MATRLLPTRFRRRWPAALFALAILGPALTDWPPGARIIAGLAAVAAVAWLVRRAREPVTRRVEAPNSHFRPPGVRYQETQYLEIRTRWDDLDLAALHEVNREVVAVLLAKARALGPDHLPPSEAELLDRMAQATTRSSDVRLRPAG